MAPPRTLFASIAALTALLGCAPPVPSETPPSPRGRAAATSLGAGSTAVIAASSPAATAPATAPDPVDPVTPADPADPAVLYPTSLDRCRAEETDSATRIAACLEVLDVAQSPDIGPNMASERAEAILALHALGHAVKRSPAVERALQMKLDNCMVIDEQSAAGVVSLVCRVGMCGDPPDWVPYDLVLETGALRTQQC